MKGTVGLIGLGIMGGAIARNLVLSGWTVHGYDLDRERCREAVESGVVVAQNAAEVARQAPLVLTSLPSAAAAFATARAIAEGGLEPCVVAEASTLALDDKLAFKDILVEGGHTPLDCPLSGTGAQAVTRDLVVYASGASDAVGRMLAVFADFAREAHDLGAFGNGTRMKLVANLLVAIHNVASAEAMTLGIKAGLDPDQIVRLISSGVGTSRIFELRAPMMASDRYEPATMKVSVWQKDMDVIGRFAEELGVEAPLFRASAPIYSAAVEAGLGPLDTASVFRIIADRAGLSPHQHA